MVAATFKNIEETSTRTGWSDCLQISGGRESATSAVWNYGEATVKLSSTLSIYFL